MKSYITIRTVRKLLTMAASLEASVERTEALLEQKEEEVEALNTEISALEDKVYELDEQVLEERNQAEYYLETMYSEEYVDELNSTILDLEDTVSELESELEDYKVIEEKTGKAPEEIIEMFTDLRAVASEFKCSECGARE